MDEPRLAHAAVVERRRVAGPARRTPGSQCTRCMTSGTFSSSRWKKRGMRVRFWYAEPQRLHAVQAHAHARVPAHHVGDGQRALHHRADLVALVHVLPPARLGAARRFARVLRVDLGDLLVGVRLDLDGVVASCARAPSRARCAPSTGTDRRAARPSSSRNTCAVHSWIARPANSLGLSSAATSALRRNDAPQRHERRPPLARARRVERVHTPQRIALHQLGVLGRDRGHLVLADQRVAADEHRRRDRAAPSGSSAPYSGSHHSGLSSP